MQVEMWGCRSFPLGDSNSSVWLAKTDHLYGNHLLLKLGEAEVVKGAPEFSFSVSQFHLLEDLSVVQAEPFSAMREVQEDHSRHRALPCSLWKEFKRGKPKCMWGL